mmetsp:Transcript_34364/g.110607  ORF Transcript_34364/g.110607 Transcript_34364/m.110607 type:complete len:407 (+) Transcript_34364:1059-2279(+)
MLLHQLVERLCVRAHSVHLRRADRVARHRDTHHHAARLSARKDAAQLFGGGGRLLRLPADAVLVGEERLADGVRVRDIARVNERDRLDAPAEKAAGHGTAQRACADEQAPLRRDLLRLERRHEPPPHEPDVEVDRRRGGRCRVHLRRQVHQPRAGPARRVLLPPDRGGRRRRPAAAAATRRDLGRSGRADEPRGAPLGDRCCLEIEAASEQLPHVAHVQRAYRNDVCDASAACLTAAPVARNERQRAAPRGCTQPPPRDPPPPRRARCAAAPSPRPQSAPETGRPGRAFARVRESGPQRSRRVGPRAQSAATPGQATRRPRLSSHRGGAAARAPAAPTPPAEEGPEPRRPSRVQMRRAQAHPTPRPLGRAAALPWRARRPPRPVQRSTCPSAQTGRRRDRARPSER